MSKIIGTIIVLVLIGIGTGAAAVYSGVYDIGADAPHTKLVYWMADTVRSRSITVRDHDIRVPALDDPRMISVGAGQYASMCSSCHLAPGFDSNETWKGLYPQPPLLSHKKFKANEVFWAVKHGIKMSGMPAWGRTHDDNEMWAITAFVMKLPGLSAEQYKTIVASAPPDDDMMQMPMPGDHHMQGGGAMDDMKMGGMKMSPDAPAGAAAPPASQHH